MIMPSCPVEIGGSPSRKFVSSRRHWSETRVLQRIWRSETRFEPLMGGDLQEGRVNYCRGWRDNRSPKGILEDEATRRGRLWYGISGDFYRGSWERPRTPSGKSALRD